MARNILSKEKILMLLAGYWNSWKDPRTGIVIPSCTMIMRKTKDYVGKIHDRMPCILSQAESAIWLDCELSVEQRLRALHPVDNALLKGWQVDPKINNAYNKDEITIILRDLI